MGFIRLLLLSFQMNLPGAERAVVDIDKLRDYCLNPLHPRGRHKARVFASALRILQSDANWLRARLLDAALRDDVMEGESDEYGRRYILDFKCVKDGRSAIIRSGWIVLRGEGVPRLTTCYVLSE
jgi:hypothetical protein